MYCIHTIYRLYIHIHKITTYTSLSFFPLLFQNTSTGVKAFQNTMAFWGLSENQPATTKEILMTVRFWTHGWDLFSPAQGLIFHLWERDYRRVYAEDMKDRLPPVFSGKRGVQTKGGRVNKGGISMYVKMSRLCTLKYIVEGLSFSFA